MAVANRELDKLRLDKWLWAARFFKTRRLAIEAITGGKIHLNNERVKPSKNIQSGDNLLITRGTESYDVIVLGLNKYRRPASEARLMYEESEESIAKRESDREMRKLLNAGRTSADKKPDKRERRKIRRFVRKD